MCEFLKRPKIPTPSMQAIAAPDNAEATRRGSMEARLRRARSGAAANVLTGPSGIPSSGAATMGGAS